MRILLKKILPVLIPIFLTVSCTQEAENINAVSDAESESVTEASESHDSGTAYTVPAASTAPFIPEECFEMRTYTKVENDESYVYAEYPYFSDMEASLHLNAEVAEAVTDMTTLDRDVFPLDTKYEINIQSEVTLFNSKIASIVFWGDANTESSAFPTKNIYVLNIDLQTLEPVELTDIYRIDEDFYEVFLEKAFFPTSPVTGLGESYFPEVLEGLGPEYGLKPFSDVNKYDLSFFLKPEGIVLSINVPHSEGDHFEAELLYSDIKDFCISEQLYWEEQSAL